MACTEMLSLTGTERQEGRSEPSTQETSGILCTIAETTQEFTIILSTLNL